MVSLELWTSKHNKGARLDESLEKMHFKSRIEKYFSPTEFVLHVSGFTDDLKTKNKTSSSSENVQMLFLYFY